MQSGGGGLVGQMDLHLRVESNDGHDFPTDRERPGDALVSTSTEAQADCSADDQTDETGGRVDRPLDPCVLVQVEAPLGECYHSVGGDASGIGERSRADEHGGAARRTAHVPEPVVLHARGCCARSNGSSERVVTGLPTVVPSRPL